MECIGFGWVAMKRRDSRVSGAKKAGSTSGEVDMFLGINKLVRVGIQ
uniref:Uncharacterized protein n=1 Tax=Ciona intestinalis TaxID=7719 RepID=H2Y305_CIOIN